MKRSNWLKFAMAAMLVCATAAYAEDATSAPAPVKGNAKSKVYHKPACRHYKAKKTTVEFKTEQEAITAGYTACKKCAAPKKEKKAEEKTESAAATE